MASELRYGKKGEDQWTADLVALLNQRDLGARSFPIYHFRDRGSRVQSKPDFIVTHGGLSVGSAKLGQRQEVRAFSTAHEYQLQLPRTEELKGTKIHETFAVTYKAGRGEKFHLHILAREGRPKEVAFAMATLPELADLIGAVVRGEIAKVAAKPEPTLVEATRILGRAGHELADSIRKAPLIRLEPIFGGHNFFESLFGSHKELQGEKKGQALRLGAAFLFVNQILFYVLLSRAAFEAGRAERYPPISDDDSGSPSKLDSLYFNRVRATDYEPVYGIPVASLFDSRIASETTRDLVRAISVLAPSIDTKGLAGRIFQQLIDPQLRKRLGAHYTNPRAADLLASLGVRSWEDRVLDPACGSGTLLVAAYSKKRGLAPATRVESLHRRFLESDILGIDAMAFAAHLAAVNLALQEPLLETDHVQIGTTDATFLSAGESVRVTEESLPSMMRQSTLSEEPRSTPKVRKVRGPTGLKRGDRKPFNLDPVDLVITNPPFTSWENMTPVYRESLKTRYRWIEKQGYSGRFWWRMSQQAFFLLQADRLLKPGGRLAAVLPLTTFTGRAFEPFAQYILSRYRVEAVVVGLARSSFSEDTSLTECLFVAEKSPPEEGRQTLVVGTKRLLDDWTDEDIERLRRQIKEGAPFEDAFAVGKRAFQDDLYPWKASLSSLALMLHDPYERAVSLWQTIVDRSGIPLVSFSDLTKKTGIEATRLASYFGSKPASYFGASALVILRHGEGDGSAPGSHGGDRLLLRAVRPSEVIAGDRIGGAEYHYPRAVLAPAIRRLSGLDSLDFTADSDYIATKSGGDLPSALSSIYGSREAQTFLRRLAAANATGEVARATQAGSSRLCLMRRMNLSASGTCVVSVRSDTPVIIACDGFLFRGLRLPQEDKLLCLWFNSSPFLLQFIGRATLTEGTWLKLEDFILDRLLVPDLTALGSADLRELVDETYARVASLHFESLRDQVRDPASPRVQLDDAILRLLGVSDALERIRVAEGIRAGLAAALDALRRTMEARDVSETGTAVPVGEGDEQIVASNENLDD